MSNAKSARAFPPVAVTKTEAAAMLAMSVTSFDRHVFADIRVIRRGNLVLIPVKELHHWADENADYTLGATG